MDRLQTTPRGGVTPQRERVNVTTSPRTTKCKWSALVDRAADRRFERGTGINPVNDRGVDRRAILVPSVDHSRQFERIKRDGRCTQTDNRLSCPGPSSVEI